VASAVLPNRRPVAVFGGSFWTGSTDQGLRDGFRKHGWAVQDVDYRSFLGGAARTLGWKVAGRLLLEDSKRAYRRELIETCRRLKPDLFFVVKGWAIDPETLAEIKRHAGCCAMFYPDRDFDHDGVKDQALFTMDLLTTTKSYHLPYLKGLGIAAEVHFVAHGYSTAAHRMLFDDVSEADMTADVRYVGNYAGYKADWMVPLAGATPELVFRIAGNRWRAGLDAELGSRLVEADYLLNLDLAEAVQRARVNVSIHSGPGPRGWDDAVSTRTFEVPACGGFMLHIDNDEVRDYYTPGEEIDVFSTPEELADKCRFYVRNPDLRRRMAQKGHERCVPAYSYDRRAEEIIALVRPRR